MTASRVTPRVRWIVINRDSDENGTPTCQWTGEPVDVESRDYSLQHRRARGMGGSKLADTNQPQNLVLVKGSATTHSHGHIESHPKEAEARGFRIRQSQNPATTPIMDWRGESWLLKPDGTKAPYEGETS